MPTLRLSLADPDVLRRWSCGEVRYTEPRDADEAPAPGGLFCPSLFGETWRCASCEAPQPGERCTRCESEAPPVLCAPQGPGHLELACPVLHPWMRGDVEGLLGLSGPELDDLLRAKRAVVTEINDPEQAPKLSVGDFLSTSARAAYQDAQLSGALKIEAGPPAVRALLRALSLPALAEELRREHGRTSNQAKRDALSARLSLVEGLLASGQAPERLLIDVLPILPPALRNFSVEEEETANASLQLLELDPPRPRSREVSLDSLYTRVLLCNHRLRLRGALMDTLGLTEAKRLQEAVEQVFSVLRMRPRPPTEPQVHGSVALSVVPDPSLSLDSCGLPRHAARDLLGPRWLLALARAGLVRNAAQAQALHEEHEEETSLLAGLLQGARVSLHGVREEIPWLAAFSPQLTQGGALRLAPGALSRLGLSVGDVVVVRLPFSREATRELRGLSSHSLPSQASHEPWSPREQATLARAPSWLDGEAVLGLAWLSREADEGQPLGSLPVFSSVEAALSACELGGLSWQAPLVLRLSPQKERLQSTAGRLLLREHAGDVPSEYWNQAQDAASLRALLAWIESQEGEEEAQHCAEGLGALGHDWLGRAGFSLALSDLRGTPNEADIVREFQERTLQIEEQYSDGLITGGELHNKCVEVGEDASLRLRAALSAEHTHGPLAWTRKAGLGPSTKELHQLAGAYGLIPLSLPDPITERVVFPPYHTAHTGLGSWRDGADPALYFFATCEKKNAESQAKHRTRASAIPREQLRRLLASEVISLEDCGSAQGVEETRFRRFRAPFRPFWERLAGRVCAQTIQSSAGVVLAHAGQQLSEEDAHRLDDSPVASVKLRSPLTCEAPRGICARCYGPAQPGTRLLPVGSPVGLWAAFAVTETSHDQDTPQTSPAHEVAHCAGIFSTEGAGHESAGTGTRFVQHNQARWRITDPTGRLLEGGNIPRGAEIFFAEGQAVSPGQALFGRSEGSDCIRAEVGGFVRYRDIIEGENATHRLDPFSGLAFLMIRSYSRTSLLPRITICDAKGNPLPLASRNGAAAVYHLPRSADLSVQDGQQVSLGEELASFARSDENEGGLRWGERKLRALGLAAPKKCAVLAESEGRVSVRAGWDVTRWVSVKNESGVWEHRIPEDERILPYEGEFVARAEPLSEGDCDWQSLARLLGPVEAARRWCEELGVHAGAAGVPWSEQHAAVVARALFCGESGVAGVEEKLARHASFLDGLHQAITPAVLARAAQSGTGCAVPDRRARLHLSHARPKAKDRSR